MDWFWISISAYLLLAFASITDKFLLNRIKNSWSYTVFVCLAGSIVVVAAPWILQWPGWNLFLVDASAALAFILALFFLYESLRKGEAAQILVFIGSATPIFSFIFSLISGEKFLLSQMYGMLFLVSGALLIAAIRPEHNFFQRVLGKLDFERGPRPIVFGVLSALFYSIYFIISKEAYAGQGFLSGFVWVRIIIAIFIVLTFLLPILRNKVREDIVRMKKGSGNNPYLMLFNQGVGASGFILQNWAISLGAVAVVNALQGVQYGFLIIATSLLSRFFPNIFPKNSSRSSWIKKIAAIILISIGLYFIY